MENAQLTLLLELSAFVAADRGPTEALEKIASVSLSLLDGAQHTSAHLLDDSGENLVCSGRAGLGPDAPPDAYRPGSTIADWVAKTGEATIVADTRQDERDVAAVLGPEVRSVVAVPMLAGGGVVGVMAAMSEQPGRFAQRDEELLQLVSHCASPLFDRRRLFRRDLVPRVVHAMRSPLRLRLMAELLEIGDAGLSLDEAVLHTGRHQQDVEACFRPLLNWHIVQQQAGAYRLRGDVPESVRSTIEHEVSERAEQLGRERHVRHHLFGGMIGLDPKMQMVFELVRQVARVDVAVLIGGESGTGKQLVARAIHDISPRRGEFFGAVNCATLKESLFESQMFGHVRGAFAGAIADYVGLVERCHNGSLFLDEVSDLSMRNQVKLLSFLQGGTFTRLGDAEDRRSNFRLLSASRRDLEAMVQAGTFHEHLYHRLTVCPIRVPSLRERVGDLRYLVEGIMKVHAPRFHRGPTLPSITPAGLRQLEKYDWPGNVSELENVILRALVMAGGGAIRPEHLPEVELLSDAAPDSGFPPDLHDSDEASTLRSLDDVQREHISTVLRNQRGNIKATAEILGISRTTLYKKIRDFGIDAPI